MASHRIGSVVVVLAVSAACGVDDEVSTETSAVNTTNGVFQNGLTTNGIWQNGIWQNGIWQNGIWQNGIWQNGIWQNGIWQNGIWQNGIWQNGIWQNGIWQNGIWQNGIWQNGLWQGDVLALDVLRNNPYAGKLLQYMYACAMPAGATKTLDPGGANIVLEGAIGLQPLWDTDGGSCDESCQRWISACVLARTNAYGVHVNISMRAPDGAPDSIKAALATTVTEQTNYAKREGSYYGNIFATTPQCDGVDATSPTCTGTALAVNSPSFYACAGPASNTPQITKRFCSSQGDDGPINVVGNCLTPANDAAVCDGIDDPDHGAVFGCHTAPGGTRYDEVITVYLQDPISVCGNAVCEDGEDATSCPSDCHPDSWAQTFDANFGAAALQFFDYQGTSAVSPVDDSIVLAGIGLDKTITIGGVTLPPTTFGVIVAKLASDGTSQWATELDLGQISRATAVVAGDGSIVVAGWLPIGAVVKVARLAPDGTLLPGWPVALGGAAATSNAAGKLAVDADGDIFLADSFTGTATFGSTSFTSTGADADAFVVKVSHLDGSPLWATHLGAAGFDSPTGVSVTAAGDLLVTAVLGASTTITETADVYRLAGATGAATLLKQSPPYNVFSTAPQTRLAFNGVLAEPGGDVYLTGSWQGTYDFGAGCGARTAIGGREVFIARYSADMTACRWLQRATVTCPPDANYCTGLVTAGALALDAAGNLVVGGDLDSLNAPPFPPPPANRRGTVFDFGAGAFDNYRLPDVFLASYAADGSFRWAKHVPMVLQGNLRGLAIDSRGHVVLSGTYSGSMEIDDHLLVDTIPLLATNANTYLASIPVPAADTVAPVANHVTESFVLEATSTAGASGWFMPPTATDSANFGTNVACSPRAWSTFPIGITPVTCVAYDPFGNASVSTFSITVRDTIAPMISNVPAGGVTAEATGASGAAVTFPTPTAVDQIDGTRAVTCSPASGGVFAIGTTPVTCTTTDASGNPSSTTFSINVADTTPPALTVPTAVTATGDTATFTATAVDTVDGAVPVTCTPASGSTFPVGTTLVTCTATDQAGNQGQASFPVTRAAGDTTPPVITVPGPLVASATGASGAVVGYAAFGLDDVSGTVPVTCAPASGSVFPLGTTTVGCTAHDAAGNTGTASFTITVVDTTAPTIAVPSLAPVEATSAAGAVVTYTATAADAVDGSVAVTCTPASGSTFAIGTATVTCSAHDHAGNAATASFAVSVVDTTGPVLTVPGPIAATATSVNGAKVIYAVSATDAVGGAITPVCTKASNTTFPLGTTTTSCSATDARGNRTTKTFPVTVTYAWSGIEQPVNADGSSIFKIANNSTVPVKFKLTGASTGITNAVANLTFTKLSGTVTGTVVEAVSTAAATTGTQFRFEVCEYVFNLATKTLSAGTWRLSIDLHDGVTRTVTISVR